MMNLYFAPLEGITGYHYRNTFHRYFGGIDRFYAPFISPGQGKKMTPKERRDITPEHNQNIEVVPQLLTKRADFFLRIANELASMGYEEVNLNLGCPSGTVVAKDKGAGCLRNLQYLDQMLDEIFSGTPLPVSVKTRIGVTSSEDFFHIMEIFNRYPIKELTIHPRLQKEFYKGTPHLDVFAQALNMSKNPVCYNGDIVSKEDYEKIINSFPQIQSVMIGRGLLSNPFLAEQIKSVSQPDKNRLKDFHDELYRGYIELMSGERNVLFKMKEIWLYLGTAFCNWDFYIKKMKKAKSLSEYDVLVKQIFSQEELSEKILAKENFL